MVKSISNVPWRKHYFSIGSLLAGLIIGLLLIPALPSWGVDQKPKEPHSVPVPPAPSAIPLEKVAKQAAEVSNFLQSLKTILTPSPEVQTIEEEFPAANRDIDLQLAETQKMLQGLPTLSTLQSRQQLWQSKENRVARWLSTLTACATRLQDAQKNLEDLQKTWTLTRNAARSSKTSHPILERVDATLAGLQRAHSSLQVQLTAVLNLQSRVAGDVARCGTVLGQIAEAQRAAVGGILFRENPPIWTADLQAQAQTALSVHVPEVASVYWEDIVKYVSGPSVGILVQAGIFLGLVILLCIARRQVGQSVRTTGNASLFATVFDRPYAAALIVSLFAGAGPTWASPSAVRELCQVLAIAPMIRLTLPRVHGPIIPGLFVLGGLFALDMVRQAFAIGSLGGQGMIVVESLIGLIVLGVFLYSGNFRRLPLWAIGTFRIRVNELVFSLTLLIFCVGLVGGALGYIRLARLLVPGLLVGGVLILTMYVYLQVASGAVAFAIRVWPLRHLKSVRNHGDLLERRIYTLLTWGAILAGGARYLDYIGLLGPALSFQRSILAIRLERGSISFSLGDIAAFFLAVAAAYLVSAFTRFVLQEEVYPRIRIAPGLSYPISRLLHYVILCIGFVVALGLLGVSLSKMTVIAGAFSVGIGFGLQSVVNNFVSGLILLFERPIQIGDTVEIGNIEGEVRKIGIRSSLVRTRKGSDVIVPNSKLISEQVTNWTLTDRLRRIDLPVALSFGAEPEEVIKLLEEVATAHPKVLKYPAPMAFFMGYGDSSVNFELRAWTKESDSWFETRSELAVAMHTAVRKAGMALPFPRREVRLSRLQGLKGTSSTGGLTSGTPESGSEPVCEHPDS